MILTTTPTIAGKDILSHCGVIGAEVIFGANVLRDIMANATDFWGGRSGEYEKVFGDARAKALELLAEKARAAKGNAVVGIRFDYHTVGPSGSMMMVAATGTAVQLTKSEAERALDSAYERDQVAEHFVKIDDAEKGPFSGAQIKELLEAGKVRLSTSMRTEGNATPRVVAELIAL